VDSEALRFAAQNGHKEIVNLLWDCSEPKEALERMLKDGVPESACFLIAQRLQAEESKKNLEISLKEQTEKKPFAKKSKM